MSQVVREALAIAIQIGQPVMLWGGPGEGKSRMIEQLAEQLNRPCEVVVGSVREASDFVGLPVRVGDSVSFAPPLWATRCIEHPNTVVFLDELTTAAPSVQAAMLRNWEQGRTYPDGAARVLLAVIAKHRAAVEDALTRAS